MLHLVVLQGTTKHALVCDELLGLDDFMHIIQNKTQIPHAQQRLILNGKELKAEWSEVGGVVDLSGDGDCIVTLADLGVRDNATLLLASRDGKTYVRASSALSTTAQITPLQVSSPALGHAEARVLCPYNCGKTYATAGASLKKHINQVHAKELLRETVADGARRAASSSGLAPSVSTTVKWKKTKSGWSSVAVKRKAKTAEEKRMKRFRPSCPYSLEQRISRAISQRLYLVKRGEIVGEGSSQGPSCAFVVLGSTGNVYQVSIKRVPSCSCPDHAKGNLCKHIAFVLLKVIKLPRNSPLVYQQAFLTTELSDMFATLSDRIGVLAPSLVRNEYARLTGESTTEECSIKQRPLGDNDDCAICFDSMRASEKITFCKTACGMNFHAGCFKMWSDQLRSSRQPVTCPACRQHWLDEPGLALKSTNIASSRSIDSGEGYANLAHVSGHSHHRDTSSYSEYNDDSYSRRRHGGSWRRW